METSLLKEYQLNTLLQNKTTAWILIMISGFLMVIDNFFAVNSIVGGEMLIILLLIGLLAQSIVMGIVSLKKMYLYQSIKGATVLRYYVEWFDYFLIFLLVLGIIFIVKKYAFNKLLNLLTIVGILSFTLIVSINIDEMVAKHNIEKFKNKPQLLDKDYLKYLSIDALPIVKKYNIDLGKTSHYGYGLWYEEPKRNNCQYFFGYHFGYCSILSKYGNKND